MTLDEHGDPGSETTALELETHLSYPCVFEHRGRLYMIPENARSGRLDLYECVDVPARWAFRRTLVSGTPLVDASVVEWGGLWWMFASLRSLTGSRTSDLLLLYGADDPVLGTWFRHPMSPILADVSNARPAGAPFVNEGRLYRLAQDGARGYGWGIVVNEVQVLTSSAYVERRVADVGPTWSKRLCGTHTLNRAGDTVAMDACYYVLRGDRRWQSKTAVRPDVPREDGSG